MGYLIAIIIFIVVLVALRAIAWGKSGPTRAGWIAMILAVLGLIASFVILANLQRSGSQQVTTPTPVEAPSGGGGAAATGAESNVPEATTEGATAEEGAGSEAGTQPGAEEEVPQVEESAGGGGGPVTETTATTETGSEAAAATEAGTSQPGGGETEQAGGSAEQAGTAGEGAVVEEVSATQPPATEAGQSGTAQTGPAAEQSGTSRSPVASSLSARLDRHFRTDPMAESMIAMIVTGDTSYCDEYMKGVGASSCTFDAQERGRIYQEKVGELGPYNALLASIDWNFTYMVRCFGRADTIAYIEEMQAKSN